MDFPLYSVVEKASVLEQKAAVVYEHLAALAGLEELRPFYLKLAQDERSHEVFYARQADLARQKEPAAMVSGVFSGLVGRGFEEIAVVISKYFNEQTRSFARKMTPPEGVMLAQQIERSMVAFYTSLDRSIDNPFGDELTVILKAEQAHLSWVEAQLAKFSL